MVGLTETSAVVSTICFFVVNILEIDFTNCCLVVSNLFVSNFINLDISLSDFGSVTGTLSLSAVCPYILSSKNSFIYFMTSSFSFSV